jgi:A/G-specific adenine glycosylase
VNAFATRLLAWYDVHGRRDLPWQHPRTPYRVWLSEVMLQQTRVATVIAYFERFTAALPDIPALAIAPLDDVLGLWSGLGYYTRARNLHRAAQICVEHHAGELPRDPEALAALPGIGRSTAGAILAQAFGVRAPILDGNVRRVLARHHGVAGWPGQVAVQRELWEHADTHTPAIRIADYTQAIMDLGATLCTRAQPRCPDCPVAGSCIAHRDGLTDRLPARRPARRIPSRTTTMLVVRDAAGRVLLQRRPPTGVWAQLWSLPECHTPADATHQLRERCGIEVRAATALPPFTHTFSHYRLDVAPLLLRATAQAARVADMPDQSWFEPGQLATLGLPAPVRKLLDNALRTPVEEYR